MWKAWIKFWAFALWSSNLFERKRVRDVESTPDMGTWLPIDFWTERLRVNDKKVGIMSRTSLYNHLSLNRKDWWSVHYKEAQENSKIYQENGPTNFNCSRNFHPSYHRMLSLPTLPLLTPILLSVNVVFSRLKEKPSYLIETASPASNNLPRFYDVQETADKFSASEQLSEKIKTTLDNHSPWSTYTMRCSKWLPDTFWTT